MDFLEESQRTTKFTEAEQDVLRNLIKKYKNIMCKTTGKTNTKTKEDAWVAVEDEFNTHTDVKTRRTLMQLKNKWDYMKRTARKEATAFKKAHSSTGGGPPPPKLNDTTLFLLDTVKESVEGSQSEFDGDSTIVMFDDTPVVVPIVESDIVPVPEVVMQTESAVMQSESAVMQNSGEEISEYKLKRMSRKRQLEQNRDNVKNLIGITTPQYTRTKFVELAEKKIELVEAKLKKKKSQEKDDLELEILKQKAQILKTENEKIKIEMDIRHEELRKIKLECKVQEEELEIKKLLKEKLELEINKLK